MSCFHPIDVEVKRKGWKSSCPITVGCGHCLGCRTEQARQWSVRLMHERALHDHAYFLTLTYNEERLPANGSLCTQDFQRFVKTVRRNYPAETVRFYGCGEYGERSKRPHYHAVLFGPDFLDRSLVPRVTSSPVWRSPTLERYWSMGQSEFGSVTPASAAYVAGYVNKKVKRSASGFPSHLRVNPDSGELVYVEPEFSRMSLRPAIGRNWIEKYWRDVYPRDRVCFSGKEFPPPRYYDKVMDEECKEECFAGICEEHQDVMMQVREKRMKERVDRTEYQVAAAAAMHEARHGLFSNRGTM